MNIGNAAGPFLVEAALRYQPIGFRWADNLRRYDAAEPQRFVRYFDSMSGSSSEVLARAEITVGALSEQESGGPWFPSGGALLLRCDPRWGFIAEIAEEQRLRA